MRESRLSPWLDLVERYSTLKNPKFWQGRKPREDCFGLCVVGVLALTALPRTATDVFHLLFRIHPRTEVRAEYVVALRVEESEAGKDKNESGGSDSPGIVQGPPRCPGDGEMLQDSPTPVLQGQRHEPVEFHLQHCRLPSS